MTAVWAAIATAAGVVLAALLTYAGVRLTQRQTAKAQQAAAHIEQVKVDAAAYESARESWQSVIDNLRTDVADLRTDRTRDREAMDRLRARVTELEQSRDEDHRRIAGLTHRLGVITDYARALLRRLRDHEITYPAPPDELGIDQPGG